MKTAVLNIKIDPKVKNEAQKVAETLGFSLSTIITATLKDLTRRKSVSFSLFEPTLYLESAIQESRADRKKVKNPKTFSSAQELKKSLMK